MKARDIMTPNPAVVTPEAPLTRAAEIMRDLDVGIVPVVDDTSSMRLEGVLTPDADVSLVIAKMEHDRVRRIPVVDEAKRLVGIIAQADLAVKLGPREPLEVEHMFERVSEPVLVLP